MQQFAQPNPHSQSKYITVILLDQQQSVFYLEGSLEAGMPQYLKAPSLWRLPETSVMKKDGKYVKIRHIKGCDEIEESKQRDMGYVPNPVADKIWLKNGMLVVPLEGPDSGLYKYIMACSYLKDNKDRPDTQNPLVTIHDSSADAMNRLQNRSVFFEARELVEDLWEEVGGKPVFEEGRIDQLCNIFGISHPTYPEKVEALYHIADTMPQAVINSIANQNNFIRADIGEAISLVLLNIDGQQASLVSTNHVFYNFKAKNKAKQLDELVNYFLTTEGELVYKQLQVELRAKKDSLVDAV